MDPVDQIRDIAAGLSWWAPSPLLGAAVAALLIWLTPKKVSRLTTWFAVIAVGAGFTLGAAVGSCAAGLGLGLVAADNKSGPVDHRIRRSILTCAAVWVIAVVVWIVLDERRTRLVLEWWPAAIAVVVGLAAGAMGIWRYFHASLDPVRYATSEMRALVLERDNNRCVYCGADGASLGVRLEIDHVTPHSHGGKTCPSNLVAACSPCNALKGDRTVAYLHRRLRERGVTPLALRPPQRQT